MCCNSVEHNTFMFCSFGARRWAQLTHVPAGDALFYIDWQARRYTWRLPLLVFSACRLRSDRQTCARHGCIDCLNNLRQWSMRPPADVSSTATDALHRLNRLESSPARPAGRPTPHDAPPRLRAVEALRPDRFTRPAYNLDIVGWNLNNSQMHEQVIKMRVFRNSKILVPQ